MKNAATYTVLAQLDNGLLYPLTGNFESDKRFTPTRIERATRRYLKERGATDQLAGFRCAGIIVGAPTFDTVSGFPMTLTETIEIN